MKSAVYEPLNPKGPIIPHEAALHWGDPPPNPTTPHHNAQHPPNPNPNHKHTTVALQT